MIQHLNSNISFCELGGRLFFLDIHNDRYFQVSRTRECSFLGHLKAPEKALIDANEPIRHDLLLDISNAPLAEGITGISFATESALEAPCADSRVSLDVVRDVFLAVVMMRWRMKTMRLKPILQALGDYRNSRTSPLGDDQAGLRLRLSEAATSFNRVRPYVPIEMCCLIDSLSMTWFLAKRGLHSRLVMGVACDPFSAHAWVQHDSLVLNETMGTAHAYVPIRVI